jgi:hypothetical protein
MIDAKLEMDSGKYNAVTDYIELTLVQSKQKQLYSVPD